MSEPQIDDVQVAESDGSAPEAPAAANVPADRVMVDPRGPRFAATVTTVVLAITLLAIPDNEFSTDLLAVVLLTFQAAVFGAAALFGLKAQLYGRIYRAFIAPRLAPPKELEDEAPPRFAQQIGLAFVLVALVGLAWGAPIVAKVAVALALAAAFLNAAFNFCLGCEIYVLYRRLAAGRSRSGGAAIDDTDDSQEEAASAAEAVEDSAADEDSAPDTDDADASAAKG